MPHRVRGWCRGCNELRAAGDDLTVNTEVLPPAERRDTVRRLIALCHIANDLVDLAETGPGSGGPAAAALREHALRVQGALREVVVDLVANGRASCPDAA